MKLISWNVNGLRACMTKGFAETFAALDADVFCLQETKLQAGQIDFAPEGYECFWNYADKKGYSGTAVFTKQPPLDVQYGLGIDEHDHEGRLITLEFEDFYFVCCYTPNAQNELKRIDYRMAWEDALLAHLKALDEKKPVVYCGDLNVAHEEIDLKNPKTNRGNAGFSDQERGCMTRLLQSGFTDTFRALHPELAVPIPGGATASTPGKRTPDGASTTSSSPTGWRQKSRAPRSTPTFSAVTIARWSWS